MIKQFLRDSFLYTLANLFTKGIGFIMLPLYLSYLNKAEYGVFDYITTVGAFLSIIVTMEITQAVLRFASERIGFEEKNKIISSAVAFHFICYGLFLFFSLIFIEEWSLFLTGDDDNKVISLLALINYAVVATLYMSNIIYRSQLDAKSTTLMSAFSAAIVAILSFVFLNVFDDPVVSLLLASIFGQLFIVLVNYYRLRFFCFSKPDINTIRKLFSFSFPLVLSSLGVVLFTLSDRIMIKELLDYERLAEYGVAARFSSIVTLMTLGFQSALSPLIYNNLKTKGVRNEIKRLFLVYSIFSIFIVSLLYFFSGDFLVIFVGDEYKNIDLVLTVLSLAVLVQSAYVFFPGLSIEGKTKLLALMNISIGLFNILGNFFLIPVLGILGAGFSTLFCAVLYFSLNAFLSEKHFPIFSGNVE
ncbi:oligosaccharide flippase family protein [Vibrio scophthalmi]|uniref:Uncharacterized protein n=1 Tax=Vibrio scophthalmi TaxID=45658 RepID=A0A1E3WKC0_9VIBR|nr:oligosaccharide flippase family protein [Vibrio scophthalmi]ODS09947.1 hypothetical protein VSF3289_00185 [Vibrio scophthalmi]